MPEPGEDARVVRVEHAAVEAHGGAGDQRLPAMRVLPRQPVRLLRLQSVAAGVQQAVRPCMPLMKSSGVPSQRSTRSNGASMGCRPPSVYSMPISSSASESGSSPVVSTSIHSNVSMSALMRLRAPGPDA